jgi:excisionase family DNA binding protein
VKSPLTPNLTPTRGDDPRRAATREAFLGATEALIAEVAADEAERLLASHDELTREYLELEQVMAILRLRRTKVYELVRTGVLASFQPGKKILVPRAEVVRYADELLARRAGPDPRKAADPRTEGT